MVFKKNKYLTCLTALVILASCSTTSKNLNLSSTKFTKEDNPKDFHEIYDYQSFFNDDVEIIQAAIDGGMLDIRELNDAKILKRNYQKILSRKNYSLGLKPNHPYSKEIIELIYRFNLPINISWENLDENIIIDFDFLNTQIVFNKKHKKELEKKLSNGAMDFFTVLVFTTLKDNIGKSKLDKNTEKKLEILNMSFKEIIENA